ncbi:hypothetical protein IFR09_22720 [Pseudomonas syringae]|nr:hypothetical protein [Pseudomonas syringae]MBD8803163.1 hypothetical protein [Pseudomonas syringae]MBD8813983.1 hypothetical protein [Pseudomonas syringae]
MSTPPKAYLLPALLHQALATERISLSPTSEPPGQGADFYAFVFDRCQEEAVNAFGGTPYEAVSKVLSQLGKPWMLSDITEVNAGAAVSAIQFTLNDDSGMQFLRLWNEGDFEAIRREWPNAPEDVFIGVDPLYTSA